MVGAATVLRLVVGCELSVSKDGEAPYRTLLVHVENHAGYTNLCRILTKSQQAARARVRARMEKGWPIGAGLLDRDSVHER